MGPAQIPAAAHGISVDRQQLDHLQANDKGRQFTEAQAEPKVELLYNL